MKDEHEPIKTRRHVDAQTSNDRQSMAIFWRAGLVHKALLYKAILFPVGILFSGVIAPLFISKTLGALAMPHGDPQQYLVSFVIAASVGLVCNRFGHPAFVKHHALVTHDLMSASLDSLLKRGVGFHNNTVGGKLVSDALDYPEAYGKFADSIATGLIPLAVTLVAGALIIYPQSWELGLFITVLTVLIVGLGLRDSRRMAPRRTARLQARKDTTSHVADTITNIATVKTFSREDHERQAHKRLQQKLTSIRIDDWTEMSVRGNARLIILVVLQAVLIAIIIHLVRQDPALLGAGIFAFVFTITLSNRLFEVNMLIRNIEESLLSAAPMTKLMMETPEILDHADARPLTVNGGSVVFSKVNFAYGDDNSDEKIFSQLDLKIMPGEKIGLIGPSGGGKSTLTRLLLRFEDIDSGEIVIDGQDIAKVTQNSLRQSISYVPQEPLLFHRSIRENIAYGRPDATLADVKKAAKLAHADGFISNLSEAFDTIVGERGVKLSGGQRQRVAIARAILKDAPILILDEATSALDSESEVLIQDALWKLMEKRTAIVVAHRLSTIQKMDRIIVLDKGRIVEQGTHHQLLNNKGTQGKGLYATLWGHQSGGFIED